ncbi:hypothetical protein MXD62_15160 [Frankia sp. Mgl5]|uniref:hypothetical protein n=1 Tax=Frankia sp. Mgl5 TaxID=2933793 RepID=UPI00200E7A93|nr:hypothetical protein [Frankia sp. Mgl5]MCK9928495.1 hypothetical protein [Frankia sp. Mgl5]
MIVHRCPFGLGRGLVDAAVVGARQEFIRYKAGQLCRNADHGVRGVAGNGEAIVCADNNGWRWEPA